METEAECVAIRFHFLQAFDLESGHAEIDEMQFVGNEADDDVERYLVLEGQLLRVQQRPVVVEALIAQHPVDDAARGFRIDLFGGFGHEAKAVLVDGRVGHRSGEGNAVGRHASIKGISGGGGCREGAFWKREIVIAFAHIGYALG